MPSATRAQCDTNRRGGDLIMRRTFHRFWDLPAELRYKVYEQYFLGDNSAVACHTWPEIDCPPCFKYPTRHNFLPELCLVSKALRSEAIDILMGSATLDVWSELGGRSLSEMVRRNINQCLFSMTRKLAFTQINMPVDQEWTCVSPLHDASRDGPMYKGILSARVSNIVHNQLILELTPRFPNLKELHLGFHAPTVTYDSSYKSYAYPIDGLLKSFKPTSLGMPKLRKVTVSAHASSECYGDPEKIIGRNPAYLRAVMVPAQKIKDDFAGWGRDVTVKVQLFYAGNCEETTLKASKTNSLLALESLVGGMTIWDRLAADAKTADT